MIQCWGLQLTQLRDPYYPRHRGWYPNVLLLYLTPKKVERFNQTHLFIPKPPRYLRHAQLKRDSPIQSFSCHHLSMAFRITLLLSFMLLTGCFSTHLQQDNNPAEIRSLVKSTQRSLPIEVHDSQRDSSRGYQFLLGILPVARIFTDNISETVTSKLQYHAGREGLGLHTRSAALSIIPRLHITVVDVTVNGYDLVIMRRPSAHITLRGTLSTTGGGEYTCEERSSDSTLSRFAFSSDLNQVLESAVDTAAAKLLRCLGLSDQQASNEPIARLHPTDLHGSL